MADAERSKRRLPPRLAASGLVLALGLGLGGHDAARAQPRGDHNRAQSAVLEGQILPLHQILLQVRKRFPGRVLDAQLRRQPGADALHYEVKVLDDASGRVSLVLVDAKTGQLLGVR